MIKVKTMLKIKTVLKIKCRFFTPVLCVFICNLTVIEYDD